MISQCCDEAIRGLLSCNHKNSPSSSTNQCWQLGQTKLFQFVWRISMSFRKTGWVLITPRLKSANGERSRPESCCYHDKRAMSVIAGDRSVVCKSAYQCVRKALQWVSSVYFSFCTKHRTTNSPFRFIYKRHFEY